MPIELARPHPPASSGEVLARGLNDLWPTTDAALTEGSRVEREAGQPLPIFVVDPVAAESETWPDQARQEGWRYLINAGASVGIADLSLSDDRKGVEFASFAEGEVAAVFEVALHMAENALAHREPKYQIRIILIPNLYAEAIWLLGPQSTFIPYVDDRLVNVEGLKIRDDYVSYIVSKAHRKLEKSLRVPW